jgi:RNA polymerase sigma-70 factor (ECF subfamily)
VVHLAFFEDLPYGEIADIVGCPEGTVKTRMFHAKKALMKCLQGLKEMGLS